VTRSEKINHLSILSQNVVATHKGSLVDNSVHSQKKFFVCGIKIATPLPTLQPNLKNYKCLKRGKRGA